MLVGLGPQWAVGHRNYLLLCTNWVFVCPLSMFRPLLSSKEATSNTGHQKLNGRRTNINTPQSFFEYRLLSL